MTTIRLLPLALLVACGLPFPTGGGSSSSSSGGGASEPAVVGAYRAVFSTLCAYHERCKSSLGPAYTTVDACEKAVAVQVLVDHETYLQMAEVYDVDAAALTECLRSLESAACVDRVPPELIACQSALKPRNPRSAGGQCSTRFDEGAPRCENPAESYCAPSGNGCGVCGARKAVGSECGVDEECLSNYCAPALFGPRHCEAIPSAKGRGEGCADTADCQGNLVCAGPLFQKKCADRVAAGEACSASRNGESPECLLDLTCISGVCARLLDDGAACARHPVNQPSCAAFCLFTSGGAEMGTCGMPVNMPANGQPCVIHAGAAQCHGSGDLFTDERFSGTGGARRADSCVCSTRQAGGTACFEDEACRTFTCMGETESAAGACTTPLAQGAMCTTDSDCESGFCLVDGNTRSCADAPMCR